MTTQDIQKAAAILEAGGLVAFPTETVYGLGADARNEDAIHKIFAAKERPFNNPLIVHIADVSQLSAWARDIPENAFKLAQAFWPGSLTLILKKQPHVSPLLTGGQDTVGIRIPAHPIALALLNEFGHGVAAPSANKFTHISPTLAAGVEEELGDKVDLILDGGECAVGLESTILDMSQNELTILRPGMIAAQAIAEVLGVEVKTKQSSTIKAPGMHHLHYAPITKTRLIQTNEIQQLASTERSVLVLHSNLPIDAKICCIQMPKNAKQYAHDIYRILRELDHQNYDCIYIEAVPHAIEWEAIRDRLSKAAR